MSSPTAGRELLFGLLALQNDFIDRDALLDAFQRRAAGAGKSLDAILVERGALATALHPILSAVVDEHIRRHGGDPGRSLAALSSIGSAREELERILDPEVRVGLAFVASARTDDDPDRPVGRATLGDSSSIGERFRVVRPHAKGGLGQVSVAHDRELDRPVALKEIQDAHANDLSNRARFVQEAQITGKLEHPGIVPVYGMGHDASGRPFYAMRFIQGDSLKDAILAFRRDKALKKNPAARLSRLRELLRRFTDVCDAIAYAHSRGVLHRDLKPGNIMLGPYGETLVVDWGLAKPMGADEPAGDPAATPDGPVRLSNAGGVAAETMVGHPIGTPAFASPEQVTGSLDRLGPATDIYGLGATLYALLTGRAPVNSNDPGEAIRRVGLGEIPPARSIDPTIPRPLEAICQKAMATEPEARYRTALELAADVTRWLDGGPVAADREPIWERAGRWMRRHRTTMSAATAAVLAGLIGSAAVVGVQMNSNRELKRANEKTTAALARSEDSLRRAETVLRFLREDVLAAARPEGMWGGLGADITVRRAVEAAEPRIAAAFQDQPIAEADIRDTIGFTSINIGEPETAIRHYERASELRRAHQGPGHSATFDSRHKLALAYEYAGRAREAVAEHESNLAQMEASLGPDDPAILASRDALAEAYRYAGRIVEAIALHEATLQHREASLAPDHLDILASRNNLANAYRDADRIVESIAMHEATLRAREARLGTDHPVTLSSRNNLAVALCKAGRAVEAIALLEPTLRGREARLGTDHPVSLASRHYLAAAYRVVGRLADAIELYRSAFERREARLGHDHPETLASLAGLAQAITDSGHPDRAIPLLERASRGLVAMLGPDHPETHAARGLLTVAYATVGRPADAEPILRDVLSIRERSRPDDWSTFDARSRLGGCLLGRQKYAEAEPLLVSGFEGMKDREAKIPTTGKARLTEAVDRLVRLYDEWGKPDKAAEWRARLPKPHP